MATKVKVTKEGLLIPKEVTDRVLGEGSKEVEISEGPGRLLILPATERSAVNRSGDDEDPILLMGSDPVNDEITDASVNHDRYLYTGE